MKTYEYAGFEFEVVTKDGEVIDMKPVEGQHPAAYKERHRVAARQCYEADNRSSKRK